eukprot:GILK01005744.1.p1 GENE.GILK01005744.1~~GILK01005744.1.p1  ORF type:complete len:312 (-),score=41.94 GILK01005744.1:263-1135(-)
MATFEVEASPRTRYVKIGAEKAASLRTPVHDDDDDVDVEAAASRSHAEPLLEKSHDKHSEKHFMSSEVVQDAILGMSDGLTVPFALAAGLAGAVSSSSVVVTACIAEIVAGSISMGLGGYLAGRSEIDHYDSERKRELQECEDVPEKEKSETREILAEQGVPADKLESVLDGITRNRERWVDFMMKFELGLDRPNPSRAWMAAFVISFSYLIGGLIPLIPFLIIPEVIPALKVSIIETIIALFVFGIVRGHFTGVSKFKSAIQATIVGSLAAGIAFGVAYAVQQYTVTTP